MASRKFCKIEITWCPGSNATVDDVVIYNIESNSYEDNKLQSADAVDLFLEPPSIPASESEDEENRRPCTASITCNRSVSGENLAIAAVDILSNARNIEVFSPTGEYLITAEGIKLDVAGERKLFLSQHTFDEAQPMCALNFVSLVDPKKLWLHSLHITLAQSTNQQLYPLQMGPMINMDKVSNMVADMEGEIPDRAKGLMTAITSMQKSKEQSMGSLGGILGGNKGGGGGSSGMSGLMGMFASMGIMSNLQQSKPEAPALPDQPATKSKKARRREKREKAQKLGQEQQSQSSSKKDTAPTIKSNDGQKEKKEVPIKNSQSSGNNSASNINQKASGNSQKNSKKSQKTASNSQSAQSIISTSQTAPYIRPGGTKKKQTSGNKHHQATSSNSSITSNNSQKPESEKNKNKQNSAQPAPKPVQSVEQSQTQTGKMKKKKKKNTPVVVSHSPSPSPESSTSNSSDQTSDSSDGNDPQTDSTSSSNENNAMRDLTELQVVEQRLYARIKATEDSLRKDISAQIAASEKRIIDHINGLVGKLSTVLLGGFPMAAGDGSGSSH